MHDMETNIHEQISELLKLLEQKAIDWNGNGYANYAYFAGNLEAVILGIPNTPQNQEYIQLLIDNQKS
jgi:hypothetical protein